MTALAKAKSWHDVYNEFVKFNEPGDSRAGKMFEEFCKGYFLAEPSEQKEFKNVWHHTALPPRIRKKLTINKKDHGVDLVLEHQDGRFFAAQCKF